MSQSEYAGTPVLVTGGLGFIGSNLAARLADLGADVTAVDSLLPDYGGNLFNLARLRGPGPGEHRRRARPRHGVPRRRPGGLFNLAGQVSHIDSMTDPFTDLEINCRSQLWILEAVRKRQPGRARSSTPARARCTAGRSTCPWTRPIRSNPTDVNGINKISGEFYHLVYHSVYGIRGLSLRLTNTYGPRQLIRHPRQGFIGWFVRQARRARDRAVRGRRVDARLRLRRRRGRRVPPRAARTTRRTDRCSTSAIPTPSPSGSSPSSWSRSPPAGRSGIGRSRPIASGSTSATSSRTTGRSASASVGSRASACARVSLGWSTTTDAIASTTGESRPVLRPSPRVRGAPRGARRRLPAGARVRSDRARPRGRGLRAGVRGRDWHDGAVGVASGTDALELALRALELPPQSR